MKERSETKASGLILCVVGISLLSGCAAHSTDPSYMMSNAYQQRQAAGATLFKGDEAVLGGEAIEKILTSRVEIPPNARLAILALHQDGARGLWATHKFRSESKRENDILFQLRQCNSLADVLLLPGILTPDKKGIPQLREAAARLQAHLLLVYNTSHNTFVKDRFLGTDETKTYCVVEAALLDVRTGVVPFTSVSLQEYKVKKQKEDLNLYEASLRAQMIAETNGLKEIAGDLQKFLDEVAKTPANRNGKPTR